MRLEALSKFREDDIMRLVIQRVTRSSVVINGNIAGKREINKGMCVLVGVTHGDTHKDADWLAEKLVGLRIFQDTEGKINLSLQDVQGDILIVSQFSLYASCAKGRRPGFSDAASPDAAEEIYNYFVQKVKALGVKNVQTGEFGADMSVEIINDGPLTFIIDTPEKQKG